ncbi:hypothetical protein LWI29_028031 [Acer saccharum]|uniref:Protein kinase domain-containing protein n=1 Tax=Acer saccharum TaxID=4024 RepID=A0AA39T5P6_ACESA|nr:hypothetical protein LWI29_028031 [Acer saccharum]
MRVLCNEELKKWVVTRFSNDHNHNFVTPSKRIRMRGNRHMPDTAKALTETFNRENIPVGKVPSIFGGASLGFNNKDCWNHLQSIRLKELEKGDAQSAIDYFKRMQRENPQFFYAIQVDEDGKAVNFFWVDARSRAAYEKFCDVVTFDTTYRTNKYGFPFAPFSGVNHHYQTIEFGCALLRDETEVSFIWLFSVWLEAMGGRHPILIITDQDHAMRAAIKKFQIIFLVLWPVMALAQAPPGSPTNCTSTCGNVTIPFPFGIDGQGCSMDYTTLKVDCNHSKPYLHAINLELLNISIIDGTIRINFPVYNMSGTMPNSNLLKSTPFIISPLRNNFVGIGNCGSFSLQTNDDSDIARCSTSCDQNNDTTCQDEVKSPLKGFNPYMDTKDRENEPYYSALVERQWLQDNFKNPQDIKYLTHVPVVMDWSIPALPFDAFENGKSNMTYKLTSTCERTACSCFSTEYPTVRCKCLQGFKGNPYLLEGCQDIDECAENATICGPEKYCENNEGSYNCYPSPTAKNKLKLQMIIIGLSTSFGTLFLIIGAWLLYKMIKRRNKIKLKEKHFKQNGGLLLKQKLTTFDGSVDTSKLFNSKELDKATDHFNIDRILGQGGQGTVYKGMLADGRIVAVKKSKVVDKAKLQEFINEVVILSQINHRNVVKLLGCCLETEVPLLVYEFIQNGTLFHYLHEQNEDLPFTWDMRLRIAKEIAGALSYLHSSASIPIYHRDIKTSNILLDDKYRAKVADFGTSRSIPVDDTHLTTKVQGTFGYFDPEYFRSNQFTDKSDV